jgi:hypothetical protein
VFCPEQAVLDDAHIGMIKYNLSPPPIREERRGEVLGLIREVMSSDHRTYIYNLPLPTKEPVYICYPLEDEADGALGAAHRRYEEILDFPHKRLPQNTIDRIVEEVPGILEKTIE